MTIKPTLFALLLAATSLGIQAETADSPEITVYRSPTCGCCGKWLEHMKANQFKVKDVISDNMPAIKQQYGVPAQLASCHTAIVNGYVIEGHVPASDVKRLLTEKPAVAGLAAPGMPMGSPGMEMGGHKDAYQVMSFDKNGQSQVFENHGAEQ